MHVACEGTSSFNARARKLHLKRARKVNLVLVLVLRTFRCEKDVDYA
jgi:hypothetical protein